MAGSNGPVWPLSRVKLPSKFWSAATLNSIRYSFWLHNVAAARVQGGGCGSGESRWTKRARPAFTGKVALAALNAIRRSRRSRNRRHGLWGATGISHASWLNQVEIWFSILAGKSLKGASFQAVASRFPDGAEPFPVRAEKFPVPQRREFRGNTRNLLSNSRRFFGPGRAIPRNSLSFSLLTGNLPRRQVRGGLARQPVFKPLILHLSLSLQEAYFPTNLRGLLILRFAAETVSGTISAAAVAKISPAPFRG
jgi:hypothetical protein